MTNGRGKSGSIDRFYFGRGGFKITADGDCSHEVKRHLLLGRKAMTNLDSILKGRDKPEVVRSAPIKRTSGKTFLDKRQKQSKEIIDWL